jgi:soluble lytic murein transglycosylase-like protein
VSVNKALYLLLSAGLVVSEAAGAVHVAVRDGRKVIYNDAVDSRRYRPIEMSDGWLISEGSRPTRYDELIARAAEQNDLDPKLVKSIMLVESGYNPQARSRKGARGLMQLMPETAARFGVRRILDPVQNIMGAARYLTHLLNMFDGDLEHSLAAYNAGENAVIRYGGIPPYDETQLYVEKTLTAFYGRPYLRGGFRNARTRYRKLPDVAPVFARPVYVVKDADAGRIRLTTDPGESR